MPTGCIDSLPDRAMTHLRPRDVPLESLMSRYFALKQELDIAYRQTPWQSGALDRLANEVIATERRIAAVAAPRQSDPELVATSVPRHCLLPQAQG